MSVQQTELQRDIRDIAVAATETLWGVFDGGLVERRDFVLAEVPPVVGTYGELAAVTAADNYETVTGRSAVLAADVELDAVQSSIRWAMTPAFSDGNMDAALRNLVGVVDRFVLTQSDETLRASSQANQTRFAWVLEGPNPCGWCIAKASRGAVYSSDAAARAGRHANCQCSAQPVATESDMTQLRAEYGYSPEAAYEVYAEAARNVGTSSFKRIAAEIDRLRAGSPS